MRGIFPKLTNTGVYIMESIQEWLTRNQHQSLQAIVDSMLALGYTRNEISEHLKEYINGH